jgi:hypothetical protein
MASESVAIDTSSATLEIDAREILAKFDAANDLGALIENVQGILNVTVEQLPSSAESKAIWGALRLLEIAAKKSDITQFSYGTAADARRAIGEEI